MNAQTPSASGSSTAVETKAQKFTRLCEARASRVLEDLRLVTQLNTRAYEHTPFQAEVLVKTLGEGVAELARAYTVPFVFKAGKPGKADPTLHIFEEKKSTALVETHKGKLTIARAIDMINEGKLDEAKTLLTELI